MNIIVTHDGRYHLDDVMAGAVLTKIFRMPIIRTRDPIIISAADLAFDVGNGKFDHHYNGAKTRSDGTIYSSFGLIWEEYGRRFLSMSGIPAEHIEDCWKEWDKFAAIVDAHDNGVQNEISSEFGIAGMVANFNDSKPYDYVVGVMLDFMKAKTSKMLKFALDKQKVFDAIKKSNGGPVIELSDKLFWEEIVHEHAPNALFIIYLNNGIWRANAVPIEPGSFTSKRKFNLDLCGAEPEVLAPYGLTFVHKNGFTAGGKTKVSVLWLIKQSM